MRKAYAAAPIAVLSVLTIVAAQSVSLAQIAGTETLTTVQIEAIAAGWSVKKQVMGKEVYNDKDEKIGTIEDLIVAPGDAVSYVVIGAGGFLGMDKHDVLLPAGLLQLTGEKYVLTGATKDAVKALPEFHYAK